MPPDDAAPDEISRLGSRVRWLDRHRRLFSIVFAVIAGMFLLDELWESLGSDWSPMHVGVLAVMFGSIAWWAIEFVLAAVAAVWETKLHHMTRERGLPRAELVRRKR